MAPGKERLRLIGRQEQRQWQWRRLMSQKPHRNTAVEQSSHFPVVTLTQLPALQQIYDTAPIGLAVLSPDCRYLHINQRLTDICGISVADHLGRFVRDCV